MMDAKHEWGKALGIALFAALLAALPLCALCEATGSEPAAADAPAYTLPIDFSPGMPLDPDGFGEGLVYEDPTIRVSIEEGRVDDCDFWVARIKIADASQLRTMAAGSFDGNRVAEGALMARRANAALAIDGDYYFYTGIGYVVRQGVTYADNLSARRDVLLIDEDGDFHVYYRPDAGAFDGTVDGKKIVNALYFGPILVKDGMVYDKMDASGMAINKKRQRMCIAQTGPLEYMCVCCAGPARGSYGMTLERFAQLVASKGAIVAYNLDGGDSTMMIFGGEKINDVKNHSVREISDIVYFASAWPMEARN